MKMGITIWNERIAPVFDVAGNVYIVDAARNTAMGETMPLPQAPFAKIDALLRNGVEVLVCGAISRPLLRSAHGAGLQVIPFASGSVAEVVAAWNAGKLETAARTMPGCGCRQRGRRNQGGNPKGMPEQGCGRGLCMQSRPRGKNSATSRKPHNNETLPS
ncbi:MAG: NifB/NifX family molybdenum-iron cluster-binding protein [Desulfuromonadaceae bacterium]